MHFFAAAAFLLLCVLALMVTAPRSPDLVHSGSTSTPVIYQGSPTP